MDSEIKVWDDLVERIECGMTTLKDGQIVHKMIEELLDLREIVSKVNEPLEEAYDISHGD